MARESLRQTTGGRLKSKSNSKFPRPRRLQVVRTRSIRHGFVIRESRRAWWLTYWGSVFGLVVFALIFNDYLEPQDWRTAGVIASVPAIVCFLVITYHYRVVIDRRDETCRMQHRWCFVPVYTRRLTLRGARLVIGRIGLIERYDPTPGAGAVTLLIPLFGSLIEAIWNPLRKVPLVREAGALFHVDAGGKVTPLFAMKPNGRADIDNLFEIARDILDPSETIVMLPPTIAAGSN